jgi:hypothetical protein
MSTEEGFLSRWSRRKRGADVEPEAAPAPPAVVPDAPELPAFDPASLPPVEGLTAASDFTAFLRAEVPAALRQAALRRAWTLDPAIRDFIGPADYAWDYNAPDGVPGFALELGGDVKRLLAQAIGALEDAAAQAEPPETPTVPEVPPPEVLQVEAPATEPEETPPAPETPAPRPRRHGSAIPI